jgi:hypothetical protein
MTEPGRQELEALQAHVEAAMLHQGLEPAASRDHAGILSAVTSLKYASRLHLLMHMGVLVQGARTCMCMRQALGAEGFRALVLPPHAAGAVPAG